MSTLNVDKVDPSTGTALEIGSSGDTVTVPSGVGLTLTDSTLLLPTTITSTTEVKTNKISPATGTAFDLGDSGDTFTIPSGATITNSGTATGFGGGKILQVVSSNLTTQMTSSSTSYVDTGLTATITPSATSSKVLVLCNVTFSYGGDNNGYLILLRDTTEINSGSGGTVNAWAGINSNSNTFNYSAAQQACNYLDSPSTTSATTYKVQTKSANVSYSVAINRRALDTQFGTTSNITLLEVGV
jgi:hypothetical protein